MRLHRRTATQGRVSEAAARGLVLAACVVALAAVAAPAAAHVTAAASGRHRSCGLLTSPAVEVAVGMPLSQPFSSPGGIAFAPSAPPHVPAKPNDWLHCGWLGLWGRWSLDLSFARWTTPAEALTAYQDYKLNFFGAGRTCRTVPSVAAVSCYITGPEGAAFFGVRGRTVFSLYLTKLGLPVNGKKYTQRPTDLIPLAKTALAHLPADWRG